MGKPSETLLRKSSNALRCVTIRERCSSGLSLQFQSRSQLRAELGRDQALEARRGAPGSRCNLMGNFKRLCHQLIVRNNPVDQPHPVQGMGVMAFTQDQQLHGALVSQGLRKQMSDATRHEMSKRHFGEKADQVVARHN
jgi:hypothetical protein